MNTKLSIINILQKAIIKHDYLRYIKFNSSKTICPKINLSTPTFSKNHLIKN